VGGPPFGLILPKGGTHIAVMVGVTGFEGATPASRRQYSAKPELYAELAGAPPSCSKRNSSATALL